MDWFLQAYLVLILGRNTVQLAALVNLLLFSNKIFNEQNCLPHVLYRKIQNTLLIQAGLEHLEKHLQAFQILSSISRDAGF